MFPMVTRQQINSMMQQFDFDMVTTVDFLSTSDNTGQVSLPTANQHISVEDLPDHATLKEILEAATSMWPTDGDLLNIKVARDCLWEKSVTLYKRLKIEPEKLKHSVCVEFRGEEGVDGGALQLSFFEMLIFEINNRLFEGHERARVPKKDWDMASMFETAGLMVAHSVLHGGSGMPCLLPAVFAAMCLPEGQPVPPEVLPSVEDIPHSLAYSDLVEFIMKVCQCVFDDWLLNFS